MEMTVTGIISIIAGPPPSLPATLTVTTGITSLTFNWSQPPVDIVYTLDLDYQGECIYSSENGHLPGLYLYAYPFNHWTFHGLEEFSEYLITVTASNPISEILVWTQTVTTLPAAPSGPVQNLQVTSNTSTSITIQWDRVECLDRNSEITGYTVSYGSVSDDVSGTDMREYTASGLIPRTRYSFIVTPISGTLFSGPLQVVEGMTQPLGSPGELPLAACVRTTTPPPPQCHCS